MTSKLVVICLLVAFGWAAVKSSDLGKVGDRFQKPKTPPSVRQVKILSEDETHRRVKHVLGETEVPISPQRIASLSSAGTDSLLALGIKPVLATTSWMAEGSASYLAGRLKGVKLIRQAGSVNLEEILAAKPDLILANSRDARLYGQLSKIAPTVCLAADGSGDRENRILDLGDIVGRAAEARARRDEYRRHVAEAKEALAAHAAGQPVVFLRFRRNTCVIYTQASMFGPLLFKQLGLTPDPTMPIAMTGGGWDVLSVERLSTLQAEHIFMVIDPDSEVYLRQVMDTPIWKQLPAVQHDHVHRVASSTWLGGDGILGCEAILADVLAAMIPTRSSDAIQ
ncbi:MAG TPA: ABC transporter substrate-binding protein [Lacipirellulaceae bacterium]|jgi:iron complex transport system substrate-binding protein|nr:ABC transporter substrate-binding protein [Lacipirellulaceae bacterium]